MILMNILRFSILMTYDVFAERCAVDYAHYGVGEEECYDGAYHAVGEDWQLPYIWACERPDDGSEQEHVAQVHAECAYRHVNCEP